MVATSTLYTVQEVGSLMAQDQCMSWSCNIVF